MLELAAKFICISLLLAQGSATGRQETAVERSNEREGEGKTTEWRENQTLAHAVNKLGAEFSPGTVPVPNGTRGSLHLNSSLTGAEDEGLAWIAPQVAGELGVSLNGVEDEDSSSGPPTFLHYLAMDLAEQLNLGFLSSAVEKMLTGVDVTKIVSSLLQSALQEVNATNLELCRNHSKFFLTELFNRSDWAVKMFDAGGKPEPGVGRGNVRLWGNYDECLKVAYRQGEVDIKGNYIILSLNTSLVSIPRVPLIPNSMEWHLCLPDSCAASDLHSALVNMSLLNVITVTSVTSRPSPASYSDQDVGAIVCLTLLALLSCLVLLSTVYDVISSAVREDMEGPIILGYGPEVTKGRSPSRSSNESGDVTSDSPDGRRKSYNLSLTRETETNGYAKLHEEIELRVMRQQPPSNGDIPRQDAAPKPEEKEIVIQDPKWRQVLLAFSLPRNAEKILHPHHVPGSLTCVHGMRVLSMAWVIYGHVYYTAGFIAGNLGDLVKLMIDFWFQIMVNGGFAVDTFFIISGALTAFLFLKEVSREGRVTARQMALYYFHRFWRLTPVYMAVIMFYATLPPYIVEKDGYPGSDYCQKNWWTNLLYVNNLVDPAHMCLTHCWYLANDMQFYVVAPLVLVPLAYRYHKVGLSVIAAFIVVHVTSGYVILEDMGIAGMQGEQFIYDWYMKPYARIGTYAAGLFLGWLLHRTKCTFKTDGLAVGFGWLITAGLAGTTLLISNEGVWPRTWSLTAQASHQILSRLAWSAVVCWTIFACSTGNGGFVQSILGWEGWLPFSRLSYGAYLLHVMVITFENANARALLYYTPFEWFLRFLGMAAFTFLFSLMLALLVEAPCLALEKTLLPRGRPKASAKRSEEHARPPKPVDESNRS